MSQRKLFLSFVFVFATLLAACGGPTPSGEAPDTESPSAGETTAAPEPTEASTGACANAYYPVVEGATHTYVMTNAEFGSSTFVDTITTVRPDGFTLSSQFDEVTRVQEWQCSANGLVALQFNGGAAAGISASGLEGSFETTNATGVSLPANVAPGDTWTQSFDISGEMNMGDAGVANANGTAVYNFTAAGIEEVQSAAGTFNALRVEGSLVLTLQVDFEGFMVPVVMTTDSVSWFAEGVGWVMSEDTSTIEGMGTFVSSVDLQSYSIP